MAPKCEMCGREFGSVQAVKVHIGRAHKAGRKVARAVGRRGRRGRIALAALALAPQVKGVDVSALAIDELLALKTAIDARVANIARLMKQANITL